MDLPINGKMAKLATEAMICGRQMLQLNSKHTILTRLEKQHKK